MSNPRVSIVIPIYNAEKYLRQCLDSVISQTIKDIEIICVNDGSKDNSLQIIKEYADRDSRIVIIDKANSGYGNSMNCGFDKATGDYLGIVESDDYADKDMFERLYDEAKKYDADVVKSGFYYYYSIPVEKNIESPVASSTLCNWVFCPTNDFDSPYEKAEFFNIKPTIWSAIYKNSFIKGNYIRFNETPGASYQDASFNFKVFALAKRVKLVEECYLHYRQDNEASSVNSPGKVYCVCDEYAEIDRFLDEHPLLKGKLYGVRSKLKYDSYIWNYERLSKELQEEFVQRASEEFKKDMQNGLFEKQYFNWYKWNNILQIIIDPLEWHKYRLAVKEGKWKEKGKPKPALRRRINSLYHRGKRCIKEYGAVGAFRRLSFKIKEKLEK